MKTRLFPPREIEGGRRGEEEILFFGKKKR